MSDPSPPSYAAVVAGAAASPPDSAASEDAEFGFSRSEFGKEALVGTVHGYDRHVFLCYKSPDQWPPNVEAADADGDGVNQSLPHVLANAIKDRKSDMKKTRLTICGGDCGMDGSSGEVYIFPDMLKFRGLTHDNINDFVEDVLVKETPGSCDTLNGSYIFVCAHGSRDKRCGVCGPALIDKFKEEIHAHGVDNQVFVSPCTHIGGHKYAGNVIIFSPIDGQVKGHWYGYVAPEDVPLLLEQHIGEGKIIDHLWRGQMGLSEEDQKKAQQLRLSPNPETNSSANGTGGCCQGAANAACCQNIPSEVKSENKNKKAGNVQKAPHKIDGKGSSSKRADGLKWFEKWEREDTYAAIAVVSAVVFVGLAYSCYRQTR